MRHMDNKPNRCKCWYCIDLDSSGQFQCLNCHDATMSGNGFCHNCQQHVGIEASDLPLGLPRWLPPSSTFLMDTSLVTAVEIMGEMACRMGCLICMPHGNQENFTLEFDNGSVILLSPRLNHSLAKMVRHYRRSMAQQWAS